MTRRRGFIPVVSAGMSAVALIIGIGLIVGVVSALGQAFMGQMSGSFGGLNFGGSYETTSVLNGLVIETSGKTAIEDHLALSRGATDPAAHFAATNIDQSLASKPEALRRAKTMFNALLRSGLTSSFIGELDGNVPPEDEAWYIVQRWCYDRRCFKGTAVGAKEDYLRKRVVVTNPATGKSVVTSVLDWGPAAFTGRVSGLSPEAALSIGADTGTNLKYGWAVDQNVPLGPVKNVSTGSGGGTSTGAGFARTPRGFPRFLQYEGPWANERYGNCTPTYQAGQNGHKYTQGTYADAACGPSSLANVLKFYAEKGQLTFKPAYTARYGQTINPKTIGELAVAGNFRVCGNGTDSSFIKAIGEQYFNVRVNRGASWARVVDALKNGIPVIGNMNAGVFTNQGHYVVLYAIDEAKNRIYSSDSYTRNVTEAEIDQVKNQAEEFFIVAIQ